VNINSVKTNLNKQIDVKTINPIQRAKLNPKSLRLAINAQCFECIYDKSDVGTWRQQVEACPSVNCPLFCLRPKVTSQGEAS